MFTNITAIVFDFDGVLTIGGEDLKQLAWKPITAAWADKFRAHRISAEEEFKQGKGSRFDILRRTFELGGCRPDLIADMVTLYAEAYSLSCRNLLRETGMPAGTKEMLEQLSRRYPLYLNSGTPERNLIDAAEQFGIVGCFKGIYGMPSKKTENLRRVMSEYESLGRVHVVSPEMFLFVGDGLGDLKAAREFGCQFVGIPKPWNGWTKESVDFPLISVVTELPSLIGQ